MNRRAGFPVRDGSKVILFLEMRNKKRRN